MFVIVVHSCSLDVGHADAVYSLALEAARHGRSTAVIEFGRSTADLATVPLFNEATALRPEHEGHGTAEWLQHLAEAAPQGAGPDIAADSIGSITSFLHAVDTSELSIFDTLNGWVRGAIEEMPGMHPGRVLVVPGGGIHGLQEQALVEPPAAAEAPESRETSDTKVPSCLRTDLLEQVAVHMREELFNFRFRRPPADSAEGDDATEEFPLDAVFVHLPAGPDGLLDLPLFRIADHIVLLTGSTPDKMASLVAAIRHLQTHCLEECGSMAAWLSVAATTPEVPVERRDRPALDDSEHAETPDEDEDAEGDKGYLGRVPDLVRLTVRGTCRPGRSGLPELPPWLIRLRTLDLTEAAPLNRRIPAFVLHRQDISDFLARRFGTYPPTSPRVWIPVRELGRFPAPVFLDALHWSWPFGEIATQHARTLLPDGMIPADFVVPGDFDLLMQLHSVDLSVNWFSDGRFLKVWKDFGDTTRTYLEDRLQELTHIYLTDRRPEAWLRLMLPKKSTWAGLMLGGRPAPELSEEQDEAIRLTRAFSEQASSRSEFLSLLLELTATDTQRRFAEPWFVEALTLKPDHAGFHSLYARFLDAIGKEPDRADEHFRTAMTLAPSSAQYCLQYGQFIERVRNDPDQADALYEKVLQLAPEHAKALLYRCRIMLQRHDRERAWEFASRAIQSPTGGRRLSMPAQAELSIMELCLGPEERWKTGVPILDAFVSHPYREPCPAVLENLIPMTVEHPHHGWIRILVDALTHPKHQPELDGWDLWKDAIEEDRRSLGRR
jgi:hypothetical protein